MSKVKIFALGGIDENGKNMYVVEVDQDIFVMDAGLKYPEDELLGIDRVLPDYQYIAKNQKRVKGVFLTHGHMDNIGALPEMLADMPDLPIYGTELTMEILKIALEEGDVKANKLNVIQPHKVIKCGKTTVFPVQMTHSIPGSVGYAVNTSDGVVFYTSDFIFDQNATKNYSTDIGKLAYIGKQGVLALLSESIAAEKPGHTSPRHRLTSVLSETFYKAKDRIVVSVFSSNLYRIQEILDEAKRTERRVVILGRRLQKIFNRSLELGFLDFPVDKVATIKDIGEGDHDLVVIVSGNRDKPFSALNRIASGYDKYIKIREKDTVIIASPAVPGTERIAARVNDELHKTGAHVVVIKRKEYLSHHASQEDLMLLNNLLMPKFLIPVKGEYRHLVAHRNAAIKSGYEEEKIKLLENGQVLEFKNGKLTKNMDRVTVGDILIDGENIGSVSDVVLKDREILAEDGIVIISVTLDKASKEIISGPEILTRGFIYVKGNTHIIDELQNLSSNVIKTNVVNKRYDFNKVKQDMRSRLTQYLNEETKRRPMIITMIQEV